MRRFASSIPRSLTRALTSISIAACTPHAASVQPSTPAPPAPTSARAWTTTLDRDHPLVGRIWSVRDGRFVDERAMLAELRGYVLLGEKHDNPDHHALQADILRALVDAGAKPVVAFEMFDVDRQAVIDQARAAAKRDPAAIAEASDWERSGWPPWSQYAPIVKIALDADLPLVAGGLSASTMRALMKPSAADSPLDEGASLSPEQRASLVEELRASHCGHLPESMLPVMVRMQRARDAAMAKALSARVDRDHPTGVLIAGTGHTRTDRGVPLDLRERDPSRPVRSVAFVEVAHGEEDPSAYASRWNTTTLPFDFVWFTPRASDDDPCAAFDRGGRRSLGGTDDAPHDHDAVRQLGIS